MAAYAALVSVMNIIDEIEHHPRPPISLDKHQIQSLTETVTFLQEFLERSHVAYIESSIAEAAYAVEDAIETYIVDQILGDSSTASSTDLHQCLHNAIQAMDSIKKEVMKIGVEKQLQRSRNISTSVVSLRRTPTVKKSSDMVGFDDVMVKLLDKLTDDRLDHRMIIPIVGMGGIGKTTLAINVYEDPLIKEHFDIRATTSISQEFNTQEILTHLLCQDSKLISEDDLGETLHKYLSGRRYLIVLDDMWSIEAWDKIKSFFPDNNNGSRIIVTTRLSSLASKLAVSDSIDLALLDEEHSWDLFCKTVFGEEISCLNLALEEIGKGIVQNCKGLPLLIVVIGGVLKNIEMDRECWESVRKHLNSVVNLSIDQYGLKLLKLSYDHLPAYLKPCFMYMGVFEEDRAIRVSTLVKLWVSEGFIKREAGKSLEAVAEDNLKELIDRNLILVHELGSTGNLKYCKIHDLLRDLSLREAEKERFYVVIKDILESFLSYTFDPRKNSKLEWFCNQVNNNTNTNMNISININIDVNQRRIVIPSSTSKQQVGMLSQSKPNIRSFICDNGGVPPFGSLRLLRTLRERYAHPSYLIGLVFELVNLRYLAVGTYPGFVLPSSIQRLWNLHTLIVDNGGEVNAPVEIWNMPQLRHVQFFNRGLYLPDPIICDDIVVMENLQTLTKVWNFKCSEDVVRRIPNIKKLRVIYRDVVDHDHDCYCLQNYKCLQQLESFRFSIDASGSEDLLHRLTFPLSLKKLKLSGSNFVWEEMLGSLSLPLLQKLEMRDGQFKTGKWETVEGQFPSLKFLALRECGNLQVWVTESSHFPLLEEIHFHGLSELEEISSEIGDIVKLRSFLLQDCSAAAVRSAGRIVQEQKDLQDEQISFHVRALVQMKEAQALQSLEENLSPNFKVEVTKTTTFWTRPCPSFPVSSWRPAGNL